MPTNQEIIAASDAVMQKHRDLKLAQRALTRAQQDRVDADTAVTNATNGVATAQTQLEQAQKDLLRILAPGN